MSLKLQQATTPLGTSPSPSHPWYRPLLTCLHWTRIQLHVSTPNEEEQGGRHTCYSHHVQKEEGDLAFYHTRVALGGRGGTRLLLRPSSFQQPPHSAAVEQTDRHAPLLGGDGHGSLQEGREQTTPYSPLSIQDTQSSTQLSLHPAVAT